MNDETKAPESGDDASTATPDDSDTGTPTDEAGTEETGTEDVGTEEAVEEVRVPTSEASRNWLHDVAKPLLQSETESTGDDQEVSDLDSETCGTDLEKGVGCKAEVKEEGKVSTEIAVTISWRDDEANRVRISVDATLRGLPGNDVSPPLGSINNVAVDELGSEEVKSWLSGEVQRVLKRLDK